MLSKIRKNLRAFSLPLWIVAGTFVGTIFLVWGRGSVTGPSGTEIATVNGEGITIVEFNREYSNVVNQFRSQFGENFRKLISDEDLKKIALNRLITRKLLLQVAEKEGFKVSDWAVAKFIESIPAFQVNGTFSEKLYKSFLRASRLTPKAFEDKVREDLLIEKVLTAVNYSPSVTDFEVKRLYKRFYGKRKFRYKLFPASSFNPEVSLKEAKDYYEKNRELFSEEGKTEDYLLKFPKNKEGEVKAQKAFELVKEGKFKELMKMNPQPLKDKELKAKLKGKNFLFRSSDRELLLAFKYKKRAYKPFDKVKDQIIKTLKEQKAFELAEKAAKSFKGELGNETEPLDREEFSRKFKPVEQIEDLFTSKVGKRFVLKLQDGFGVFSPSTDLKVEEFEKDKLERLKNFILAQKRESNYRNFVNLLRQKATVKINMELFRSLR
jgi:peptidyl-prolyl cis-trans isomerase D